MKKSILFSLYLIPVVLLIGFVANFSVNVPIDDEWRLANLFEKIATGNVNFNDFWALHSNHRILFPKIIIAVLAFASRWNINYQLCLSIGLAVITFIAMYSLSSIQVKKTGDDSWHLANILTCILVCSLVQYENWLWGFQLAWFLVNLCFVAAVYALLSNHKLLPSLRISIAAVFCFIASFSLAQGLLSWLAAIPAVVALEGNVAEKRKRLILWILLFFATCAIYSIDYHPSRKTSIISLLNKPIVVIDYFFSLLGSPIVRLSGISAFVGLLIFGIFLFLAVHFGRKISEHREALPWLSIGFFSVLSALFITAGRAEFGAIQAIESSRYTTNSILLLIALVQLGQLFVRGEIATTNRNYKVVYRLLAGLLIGIIIVNSGQAIAQSRSALIYKQGAQDCLQLINYLEQSDFLKNAPESCLRVLSKKTWLVREGAAIIDKIGWRKLAKNVEFISNPEKVYGYLDKPQTSNKSLTVNKNSAIKAVGWAVLPENLQQPNIVLLSVGERQSFFANAYVNLDSPDIAKTLKSELYNNARWAVDLSGNYLPIAQTEIKAWVYNPVDNQFVQLRGG
ncbi:hypothetical protein C7B69_11350 [filamentous cyanobacterium Phorm 46]|nr:hypothetical protein C7B69_11350 [filamentous cyanobacterium Phorm 46]PSB52083.1 hypothetical protein C7B67_08400 [filamentous cyanobacterium Phorm 6]